MSSFTMVLYVNGAVPTMNIAKAKPGIPEVIQRVRAQAVERIITLTRGVILLMTLWLSQDLAAQMQPRPEPYPPRAPEPQPFIPPSGVPERETIVVQIRSAYDEALGRHPNGSEEAGWTRDLMGRRNYVEQRALVHWIMDWVRSPASASDNRNRIVRSYREVFLRAPNEREIAYWVNETEVKRPMRDEDDEAHTYWLLLKYHRDYVARHGLGIAVDPLSAGPQSCKAGYVWREATRSDYVCVTPDRRAQTARENSEAASHLATGRGDFCAQGFVWRETVPSDHVCVTPKIRTRVAEENGLSSQRTVLPR